MTEQQPYDVLEEHDGFEVRRYPAHLVAEVEVDGAFEDAGNRAFRALFRYITGNNRSRSAVDMTAPVVQRTATEEIAMTAPVVQTERTTDRHVVAFVMPASMTLETAPLPVDPQIRVRAVPERVAAARRYTGRWSESSYERNLDALRAAVVAEGYVPVGTPRFARYDPPFKPWFLRRNEVVQDVQARDE
ncbi:heme-binding protein [Terrabacter sp. NPDC000476]|uniref:SOUL family heme-binding protein n=1 Tax=Terrabacter sp. NPDC000476 TaxID=3154258 RepID=UPI0033231E7C